MVDAVSLMLKSQTIVVGKLFVKSAAADGGVAVFAVDPAAVVVGRVVFDRAAADGGVAVVAVDPAAVKLAVLPSIVQLLMVGLLSSQ